MTELEKIFGEIQERLGLEVSFYRENARAHGGPVCEKPFDGITDDGNYTFFRFLYKNIGYVGALKGVGETQNNYALLLPPYIESFSDKEADLSKTEYLRRILLGECSSAGVYKYMTKFSVGKAARPAVFIVNIAVQAPRRPRFYPGIQTFKPFLSHVVGEKAAACVHKVTSAPLFGHLPYLIGHFVRVETVIQRPKGQRTIFPRTSADDIENKIRSSHDFQIRSARFSHSSARSFFPSAVK